MAQISTAPPQLLVSPQFHLSSAPLDSKSLSTIGSSSSADATDPYVLNIVSLPRHYAIATSAPSNSVDVIDKSTLALVQSLGGYATGSAGGNKNAKKQAGAGLGRQAHEGGVTNLRTFDYLLGNRQSGLISSGKDGRVVIWDERTVNGEGGVKMYAPSSGSRFRSVLCCDMSPDGNTVVGGTELQGDDALIVYWDPRNPGTPLRTHSATHSDDVTVVSFAPLSVKPPPTPASSSNEDLPSSSYTAPPLLLLSASSDGLLSLSNAKEDDEDEAMLLTANWGCSIAQAGWIGDKGIWAGSDMETFSTWSPELDLRLNFSIREPSVHGAQPWVTDYLVTCQASAKKDRPLLNVFVGSNEGDVSLISTKNPLPVPSSNSKSRKRKTGPGNAPWTLHTTWAEGHVGIVRSLLYDEERGVVVTGGEDSNLKVWKEDALFDEERDLWEPEDEDVNMDEDEEDPNDGETVPVSPNRRKREVDSDGDEVMVYEKEGKRRKR